MGEFLNEKSIIVITQGNIINYQKQNRQGEVTNAISDE